MSLQKSCAKAPRVRTVLARWLLGIVFLLGGVAVAGTATAAPCPKTFNVTQDGGEQLLFVLGPSSTTLNSTGCSFTTGTEISPGTTKGNAVRLDGTVTGGFDFTITYPNGARLRESGTSVFYTPAPTYQASQTISGPSVASGGVSGSVVSVGGSLDGTRTIAFIPTGYTGADNTVDYYSIVVNIVSGAPTLNSFTFGSVVGYNAGGATATSIDVATGGAATGSPTGYTVSSSAGGTFASSASSSGGGSVSINSAGVASYTPAVGYRGSDTFFVKASNGGSESGVATVTVTVGNPTLTATVTGTGATQGQALSGYAIQLGGGRANYGCSSANAPAGVTVGAGGTGSTCALTGTPSGSGALAFNVTVTDSSVTGANGGTASPFTQTSIPVTLTVAAAPVATTTTLGSSQNPEASGQAVTFTASVTGNPSVGTVNFTDGGSTIAGCGTRPVSAGASTCVASGLSTGTRTIQAVYSGGTGFTGSTSATLSQFIVVPPTVNAAFGQSVITTAQATTLTITLTNPASNTVPLNGVALPSSSLAGLTGTIGSDSCGGAAISGGAVSFSGATLAVGGSCVIVVNIGAGQVASPSYDFTPGAPTATGANGQTLPLSGVAGTTRSLRVDQALSVTAGAATGATVGSSYSQSNPATGGVAPYTYAVASGTLPAGTSLNTATGAVTGTPTTAGAFSYAIRATDSQGTPATATGATVTGTIARGDQTITFAALPDASLSASPLTLSATSGSGLAVSFSTATPGVCTVTGTSLSLTTTGTCTVNADQAGDANYNAAPRVQRSFTVTPAPPQVADRSGIVVAYETATAIDLSGAITGPFTTITVATPPANGTTQVNGAIITYTPRPGYAGADTFAVTASGPGGTSRPASISLTVSGPLAPVITPPASLPPLAGAGQSFTLDLSAITANPVTGFQIRSGPQFGTATIDMAGGTFGLRYTPTSNLLGTDRVTVVAVGPGGESSPAVFVFNVTGKAPDLNARLAAGQTTTVSPTAGLVGGPFQALRITRPPAFGTATVSGLTITFTPGSSASGPTSFDYVVDLPFGSSAAGTVQVQTDPAPIVPTITVSTPAGRPVTVSLTADARNGPFVAATVTSLSVADAGTATIVAGGSANARTFDLTFVPAGAFSGRVDVGFTLSNAGATTAGVVQITVEPRPDPSQDPEVRGLISSQVDAARRFAQAQTDNVSQRLEQIRDGDNRSRNSVSLNASALLNPSDGGDIAGRRRLGLESGREGLSTLSDLERDDEQAFLERLNLDRRPSGPGTGSGDDALSVSSPAQETADPAATSRVGVWAGGSLDWGRRDAEGLRDTRFRSSGLSAGADLKVSDRLILGGGVGYGGDRANIGERGTLSEARSIVGLLYGSWRATSDFHLSGMIGHGDLDYDTRRWSTAANGYAFGERSGTLTFGSVGLAYDRRRVGTSLSIYGRMDAGRISLDRFTETGADIHALTYEASDADSLTSNLGVRMDWAVEGRSTVFVPSLRLEWTHEFEAPDDQTVSYADWLASPRYGVVLERWSRDSLSVDLGGRWIIHDRLDLLAAYRATLGSNGSSQGLEFKLMTRF